MSKKQAAVRRLADPVVRGGALADDRRCTDKYRRWRPLGTGLPPVLTGTVSAYGTSDASSLTQPAACGQPPSILSPHAEGHRRPTAPV
ncbi:hypothetical protein Franean1_1481 [Parafrankia sp. EAN1pec]|nr:hypothetical protein Franean1_1481 [Frankia sp. EAN1pec]